MYLGERNNYGVEVRVSEGFDNYKLKHIKRHSPTGLEYGYAGSGPADLALSILTDLFNPEVADRYYQSFKHEVISNLNGESFTLSGSGIIKWMEDKKEVE